jgi:hypothetical protein
MQVILHHGAAAAIRAASVGWAAAAAWLSLPQLQGDDLDR